MKIDTAIVLLIKSMISQKVHLIFLFFKFQTLCLFYQITKGERSHFEKITGVLQVNLKPVTLQNRKTDILWVKSILFLSLFLKMLILDHMQTMYFKKICFWFLNSPEVHTTEKGSALSLGN